MATTTSKAIAKSISRSKRVLDFCEQFQLTPEAVYFAYLINEECNPVEAYTISHKSPIIDSTKAREKVRALYKNYPRLPELLTVLKFGDNANAKGKDQEEQEEKLYSKEDILRLLQKEVKNVEGKEKANVLMKIADLQKFKDEEPVQEDDRVIFYLPKIDAIK